MKASYNDICIVHGGKILYFYKQKEVK